MYDEKQVLMKRKRESWIDVLKGIGIILVVIGHVSIDNGLSNWIYTFHMPMFFALSGYLWSGSAKTIGVKEFLLKRIKTILWPFILFRVLLVIYWIVVESHFRSLDLGPIWFLIVLFVVEIAAFFLLKGRKENLLFNAVVIGTLTVAWFALKVILPENTLCSWFLRCINGLLWYIVGHFIGLGLAKKKCEEGILRYSVLAVLFVLSIVTTIVNPGASMWSNAYGKSYIVYLIGSLIGSLLIALLCKWLITKNAILEFLGQNTIVILATREPVKRIVLKSVEIAGEKMGMVLSIDASKAIL